MSDPLDFSDADNPYRPIRKRFLSTPLGLGVVLMIAAFGLAAVVIAIFSPPLPVPPVRDTSEVASKQRRYDVSTYAWTMMADYEQNGIAADRDYKGKTVMVQGVVLIIDKDILGSPFVVLGRGAQFEILGVQCAFSRKHEAELVSLSKGIVITVIGKCKGKFGNVVLDDCYITKSEEELEASRAANEAAKIRAAEEKRHGLRKK
jgi:hypothetical protein